MSDRRTTPKWVWIVGAVVLVGAIGTAIQGDEEGDASARLACSHFRNVANDAASGILSDSELREKLKEVYDDGRYSEEADVASASRDMLAAVTSGDLSAFDTAVSRMGSACSAIGY